MATPQAFSKTKALLFDVFGTTVDWRSTVVRRLHEKTQETLTEKANNPESFDKAAPRVMTKEDWGEFAQQWRESYYKYTRSIATDPNQLYKTIDQHHHDALIDLVSNWNLQDLWSVNEIKELSLMWHYLDPWPDTSAGLRQLNRKFATSTLSNGNVELLTDMAKHADLDWTHILSAEMFESYKPSPKVYQGAAAKLGLKTEECAMVAAHLNDLQAAKDAGFGAAIYVERSQEEQWSKEKVEETKKEGWVDMWITEDEAGFVTVAEKLGMSN